MVFWILAKKIRLSFEIRLFRKNSTVSKFSRFDEITSREKKTAVSESWIFAILIILDTQNESSIWSSEPTWILFVQYGNACFVEMIVFRIHCFVTSSVRAFPSFVNGVSNEKVERLWFWEKSVEKFGVLAKYGSTEVNWRKAVFESSSSSEIRVGNILKIVWQ